jgi:catechol 2,3-dioxygenase-like lactoylglutathione lyase family enzyme
MAKSILGVHHVTAIAGDPILDTRFLGLRLVKITVNFDDPASYHLYYEDSSGHPGTILTFSLWPAMRRGRVGSSQVTATSIASRPVRVNTGAIGFESTALNSRSRRNASAKVSSHADIGAKHLTLRW